MSEITEEFFQGYCKAYDMARTAIGEFVLEQDGWVLEQIDCDYGARIHSENCQMMKRMYEFLDEKNSR